MTIGKLKGNTACPDRLPPRSRRLLYGAAASLIAVVLAGGAWFLFSRGQAAVGCEGLGQDRRVKSALGSHYSSEMSCSELGAAVRTSTTGGGAGPRTKAQADSMKQVLLAVNDSVDGDGRAVAADLRKPLAESLAGYANDVQEILDGVSSEYFDADGQDDPAWQDKDEAGYHFSVYYGDLVNVLLAVAEDPAAYAVLRNAQTEWGAAQLASLSSATMGKNLVAAPTPNASALGAYDAIAADVVRRKGASSGAQWTGTVFKALHRPATIAPAPPPSALSDRITKSWRASLVSVPAGQRTDRLGRQGLFMFTTWAEAVGMSRERAEVVGELYRLSSESGYGRLMSRLKMS
ncbi:hypothetical protein ABZ826_31745 [Streptomyces sp. NPDC047515]|uniref:hypothetical protein n=1 Tax=Streptomyces sp. NPDC047515 TaxID=3155380 RepID=UPI0033E74432